MTIKEVYLWTKNEEKISSDNFCRIFEKNGVTAMFFEGGTDEELDSELGAVIRLDE